ncbi:phage tail tube protein [Roseomonas sp. NAR14]|uniref:Phage tail tube protein n=1 Tax=Roseomonas acroporae TaxID=2937791 RepID=A0A9X1YDT7_9PROT|nr:phage tail tube protein [Roseomonas acroporae]MCK8787268.1 phage tail tube protein [Roseomonas acroporae]
MARAIGANTRLLMLPESTYGTAPTGNFRRLPFLSCDLGAEQPLLDADVIGLGGTRDAAAPFLDTVTVSGSAVVPVDLINIGHWLRLLLGAPTTTGTTNYTHTFKSGGASLPSNSIELGYPDVPSYDLITGVRADTLEIDFSPSGPATASFGLIGQGSTRSGTSSGGTPTSAAYTAFNKAQGSINRSGSALAQVTGAKLSFTNSVETVRTIRADRKIEGADPGICRATGQVTVRFADTTLLTQAQNGSSADFAFAYTIDANRSLTFTLHEVYLALAKTPIEGPGGIEAAFDFRAAYNATATTMMTIALKNQQTATEYA